MTYDIPEIIEELYYQHVMIPDRKDWPEWIRADPVLGQGVYSFYQGLRLGVQLSAACQIPNS